MPFSCLYVTDKQEPDLLNILEPILENFFGVNVHPHFLRSANFCSGPAFQNSKSMPKKV